MCLVKEEDQLGLLQIAHLGQRAVKLTQQPEQESRVQLGLQHEFVGSEHTQHTLAVTGGKQVLDIKRGNAKKLVSTLVLKLQDSTLDCTDASRGHVAILGGVLLGMLGQPVQCRTQVLDVIQQDAFLIKDAVQDIEHAGLSLVQTQDAGHQIGSHLTKAGSHADALLAKNVIKPYRTALKGKVFLVHAELGQPLLDKA